MFYEYTNKNLTNRFIWSFKQFAKVIILLKLKPNKNFQLNINYYKLNCVIIKNWYIF